MSKAKVSRFQIVSHERAERNERNPADVLGLKRTETKLAATADPIVSCVDRRVRGAASMAAPLLILTLLVFAGCGVLTSRKVDNGTVVKDAISYFLPTGRIHLIVDHKVSGTTDLSVSEVIVPDTGAHYYAQFNLDVLSKDNVKVTLNNGLLQQISSTSEDQSGVVAKNLAITAKQIMEIVALGVGGEGGDKVDVHLDIVFDPFDQNEVNVVNGRLGQIGGSIRKLDCPVGIGATAEKTSGILYRPALPYAFGVDFTGDERTDAGFKGTPVGQNLFVVNLPSRCSPTMSLDVDRTAFGKNVTTINFADGTLKDWNIDKDSELAGLSQIPVDVTAEILKLPSDLLTLRYDNVSAQDKLVNEQATLLDDQTKLIKSQQDFNAAQAAALAKPTPAAAPAVSTTAPSHSQTSPDLKAGKPVAPDQTH